MKPEEVKEKLKFAFWDVNYSPDDLYAVLIKEKEKEGFMTRERLFTRLLETYSWYKLIEFVPREQLKEMLSDSIIKKLRIKSIRKRYEVISRLL